MSIYDLPLVVGDALPRALTPSNIMSGFRAAGIMPFNRDIFQESSFLSSYVTDRPAPPVPSMPRERHSHSDHAACVSVQSEIHTPDNNSHAAVAEFSPEAVRPFPKAEPRKNTLSSRRKRHCAILTDTPVKRALEQEKEQQNNKKLSKKPTKKTTKIAKKKTVR